MKVVFISKHKSPWRVVPAGSLRANAQSTVSRQQLSPKIIVPGGPYEFLLHAPFKGVAFQEIEGDLKNNGKVFGAKAMAEATVALDEGYIQNPIQRVLPFLLP